MASKEAVLGQLDLLKAKYDEVVAARKKTEEDIEALRPVRLSERFNLKKHFPTYYFCFTFPKPRAFFCPRMWTQPLQPVSDWRSSWRICTLSWPFCREFTRK